MVMSMITVPKYVYWSKRGPTDIDPADPAQKKWWIRQVLVNGTMADVRKLDLGEVEDHLPALRLPPAVESLWRDFFARRGRRSQPVPAEDS